MKTFLSIFCLLFASALFAYDSPFEISWDAGGMRVPPGQEMVQDVIIRVPSGHFLYRDKTDLSFTALSGVKVKDVRYPPSVVRIDPLEGKKMDIYAEGEVRISVDLFVPKDMSEGERVVEAMLELQGCEEKLCLRPEKHLIAWHIFVAPAENVINEAPSAVIERGTFSLRSLLDTKDFVRVMSRGHLLALFVAFVAGLLTSLTPCVWPLVPVTLLIIGVHKKGHIFGNLLLSLSLVAGIALTYGVLGAIAASAGARISFLFQQKIFIVFIASFFIAMSLSMLGLFTINLPHKFQGFLTKLSGRGYRGAFLSGISLGLLATPCAGPLLAPMIVWVATQKEYLFGAGLLAVYAFGLGTVYIVAGTFYGTVASKLAHIRAGNLIKKILAILLLLPAIYYISSIVPTNGSAGGIAWKTAESDAIVESLSTGKPMMIVFGAKWCPPCLELKNNVLADEQVVEAADGMIPLYVDATVESEEITKILDKYGVMGWPTILFVGRNGKVYDDLTVTGEVPSKEEMVRLMELAAGR